MRWVTINLALSLIISCASAEWSWENEPNSNTENEQKSEGSVTMLEGEQLTEAQDKDSKSTILDDIVDELMTNQEGRALGGFDDVYGEPTFKYALESGDDGEARNLIKQRLCTLGLMQCEEGTDEKHYVSPGELIYAQPVDIKPVGKPIASIPIRGPPRAYGSPKPVPYPTRISHNKIPPKRITHGTTRPGFSEKYGQVSTGSYQNGVFTGFNDNNYATRPSQYTNDGPYAFDTSKPTYNKVPPTRSQPAQTDATIQQHVHHHYVHSDADKDPKVIIKPVAIPVGSVGSLTTQTIQPDIITAGDVDYPTSGFRPMSTSYTVNSKPPITTDTVYGNQYADTVNHNKGNNNLFANNAYDYPSYGNSLSSSTSNDFYKKELNVGGSGLYNQGPATFSESNSFIENYHEPKAQGIECVCVDYDQCPSQEIIGRRDDLYLPIDPRNKKSEIVALTDDQLDNVTKSENKNTTIEIEPKDAEESKADKEPKKISKREVNEDEQKDEKKEIEPRFIGLSGYGGNNNGGNPNKQVQPTFGVSFGLPQPSHGGYPINPYGPNPLYNPYGPALNSGGLNLGLISVNPLLSVQVTKNDYGEKVIKPFVNLHVTPNEHVVNKLGHLIHEKKHYLLNKHHHYHHHQYKPVPAVGHPPFVHQGPSHYGHPVYSPHHPHYAPTGYFKDPTHIPQFAPNHNDDYYDDDDDVYNHNPIDPYQSGYSSYGFERSANNSNFDQNNYANRIAHSRSINLKTPQNSGATRGSQAVKFPTSRKRRDTSLETPKNITIQERQGYFGRPPVQHQQCKANQVCCRRPLRPQAPNKGQCGIRHSQGVNGRVKTPSYVDGNSEFGEYPWQVAILKKDPKESVYVCGGTLIDGHHIITAAHCVKSYNGYDLRVRLGEWDVNHDVEFYPYIERDVSSVHIHPQYYAGTLDNDIAILKMEHPVDWTKYPHISPACLPDKYTDYAGQRCWTTGWGKDAFGDYGKYQNILNEVDVPILGHGQCQQQLRQTRLGYNYELNPGFLCAGGEEGKDACKGDGGGPLVCERGGTWQVVGVVSWGIGCGQPGIPGVYVKVAQYLDWIQQITGRFSHF